MSAVLSLVLFAAGGMGLRTASTDGVADLELSTGKISEASVALPAWWRGLVVLGGAAALSVIACAIAERRQRAKTLDENQLEALEVRVAEACRRDVASHVETESSAAAEVIQDWLARGD